MKKITIIFVLLLITIGFCGCVDNSENETSSNDLSIKARPYFYAVWTQDGKQVEEKSTEYNITGDIPPKMPRPPAGSSISQDPLKVKRTRFDLVLQVWNTGNEPLVGVKWKISVPLGWRVQWQEVVYHDITTLNELLGLKRNYETMIDKLEPGKVGVYEEGTYANLYFIVMSPPGPFFLGHDTDKDGMADRYQKFCDYDTKSYPEIWSNFPQMGKYKINLNFEADSKEYDFKYNLMLK